MIREEHLDILRRYFPEPSIEMVSSMFPRYGIHLEITRTRLTRHGDFRYEPSSGKYHITVNGSLSPYSFLLTFIHEVAHLVVHKEYKKAVKPHGSEWKATFRCLMLSLPLEDIYPSDILPHLLDYLKNPLATSDRHNGLHRALNSYDSHGRKINNTKEDNDLCTIEELQAGDKFIFRERLYTLGTKRRRLYLCTLVENSNQYLFSPLSQVKKIKHDDK